MTIKLYKNPDPNYPRSWVVELPDKKTLHWHTKTQAVNAILRIVKDFSRKYIGAFTLLVED